MSRSSVYFRLIENLSDIQFYIQYLKCKEFSTHVKHASFPCDLFNISKLIGYRYEISRLPVVLHRFRLQVLVKNRTHQSRRFWQQYADSIPVADL